MLRHICELAVDLVGELFVQIEEAAQEIDDEQRVLRPVRELLCGPLGLIEPPSQIGQVIA